MIEWEIFCLGLCVIMQYVVRSHQPINKFPLITKAADWPVFFASAMYVFEGIALVSEQIVRSKGIVASFRSYQCDKR